MLNIGFIGCGGIARHHASRLKEMPKVRIAAAADTAEQAAREFVAAFGGDPLTDHRRLLRRSDVDAVFVCTPTFRHARPVIDAAAARKHVFCEKPMALQVADARRMAEACDQAGVRLTIGFVRRFDTQWGKLKEVIQAGDLGRPVVWRSAAGGKPANPWFRDVTKGGGPLMDGAVHNYDFALQIFGPVESVQASSLQLDQTSVGADTASAILNFASGDQHSLIWSWGVARGAQVASLNDVIGPRGSLQFGMTAAAAPSDFDPQQQGALTLKAGDAGERVYTYPQQDMFVEQLRHVVRCFEQGEQPVVTGQDGIDALRVAVAVLRSGRSRRTVRV